MTMVDGWVIEKVSDDPAVLPFSGGTSTSTLIDEVSNEGNKKEKKKKEKKPKAEKKPRAEKKPKVEKKEAAVVAPIPEKVELFEPIEIVSPGADLTSSSKQKKEDSSVGKFVGAAVGVAVLVAGGFFAWPFLASLLEPADVAVFEPSVPIDSTPTQRYVIDGDTMYLEGSVPNVEVSDAIQDAASNALGGERVINNFEITDEAVFDPEAPVRLTVAETVQFGTGRAEIAQQYAPLIDLAVELMGTQPNVTLTIIGHTDNIGEEEENLRLSIERAQSTADQIANRGIASDRLTIEGRGESEPIDSNESPEGRQANRRVEFLVRGLLG